MKSVSLWHLKKNPTVSKHISKLLDYKWIADVSWEAVKVRSVRMLWGIIRRRTKDGCSRLQLYSSKGESLMLVYHVFIMNLDKKIIL